MEKKELPNKIWLDTKSVWFSKPTDKRVTEYTRTDAVIEKAVKKLEHYIDKGCWIANDVGDREKEAIIEDFRKYMEGE